MNARRDGAQTCAPLDATVCGGAGFGRRLRLAPCGLWLQRAICGVLLLGLVACSDDSAGGGKDVQTGANFGDISAGWGDVALQDAVANDTGKDAASDAADASKADGSKPDAAGADALDAVSDASKPDVSASDVADAAGDAKGNGTDAAVDSSTSGSDAKADTTPPKDIGNCTVKPETCNELDDDCDGETDESCDDGEPCTVEDKCVFTSCYGTFKVCSDGDKCTADTCDGDCQFKPYNCADNNPCSLDGCDPLSGCTHVGTNDTCDDANPCTDNDSCASGTCAGQPLACDDQNPCTADACDKKLGCLHTPAAGPCDDGNVCTSGDACSGGSCAGASAVNCDDGNACTTDTCDLMGGCTSTASDGACSDGEPCTTADACEAGSCVAGPPLVCDDSNACTDDACVAGSGCTATPNAAACDDGLACTSGDACSGGQCVGSAACEAGQFCAASGACETCSVDAHCGPSCTPCGGASPHCDGSACVACTNDGHCGSGAVCQAGACKTLCPASVFSADFTAGQQGFTHLPTSNIASDDPWAFGNPKNIGCKSGSQCFGTVLGTAGYTDCQMAALDSPSVDLALCADASVPLSLTFWHYYAFEVKSSGKWWDGGTLQFSANGGQSWSDVSNPSPPYQGLIQGSYDTCTPDPDVGGKQAWSGVIAGKVWTQVTVAIPPEFRTSQFRVRWLFGADAETTDRGWFIDDVAVVSGP